MYTNNALISKAGLNIFNNQTNNVDSADGSFAAMFDARLKGMSGSGSGLEALMDRLAARFPAAKVSTGNAGKDAADDVSETDETDAVNVDQSLLSAMSNSEELFKKVEDAIAAFLESSAGSNAMSGSYSQRRITITITTVSYQVNQRESGSGELLSSQDLQTAYQDVLKEKLQELINRIFGGTGTGVDGAEKEDDASESSSVTETSDTGKGTETQKDKNGASLWSGFNHYASFSMSLYYSQTMIQSLGNNGNNGQNASANMQSFMLSASYQSMSGFQNFAGSALPQSIFEQFGQGNAFSDSFTSMLEGSLGKMGLTSGGFSQTTDGYLFNVRNGRDFLSEFLEMAGWGSTPAMKETEAEEVVDAANEANGGAGAKN